MRGEGQAKATSQSGTGQTELKCYEASHFKVLLSMAWMAGSSPAMTVETVVVGPYSNVAGCSARSIDGFVVRMTDQPTSTAGASVAARKAGLTDRHGFRWTDLTVYLGFVLVFAFFAVTLQGKGFLTTQNATSIVSQVTPIALMAFGAVFVLTAGEIDLSIGSVVAMSALFTALGLRHFGLPAGIAFGILTGVGAGLLNGYLIVGLRVPSFLITLGTMQLFSGVAQMSTNLRDVPILNETYTSLFGSGTVGPLSDAVVWLVGRLRPRAARLPQSRFRLARDGHRQQPGECPRARHQHAARAHWRDGDLVVHGGARGHVVCRRSPGRGLHARARPTC